MTPLTAIFDVDEAASRTPPGMAHWAGTGPAGEQCMRCSHYAKGRALAAGGRSQGHCRKYAEMMDGSIVKFSEHTPACKHFAVLVAT